MLEPMHGVYGLDLRALVETSGVYSTVATNAAHISKDVRGSSEMI